MANGSAASGHLSGVVATSTPLTSTIYTSTPDTQRVQQDIDTRSPSPSHVRLSDVLKRKRVAKRTSGRVKARQENLPITPSVMQDLFTRATSLGSSATPSNSTSSSRPRYTTTGSSNSKTSFLQSLNPARWGRTMSSSHDRNYSKDNSLNNLAKSTSSSHITAGNREKTRSWVREQVKSIFFVYF